MSTGDKDGGGDRFLLQQARERALALLNSVDDDLNSLRAGDAHSKYIDGAALCEQVADAARELMARLDAELQRDPESNPSSSSSESPKS